MFNLSKSASEDADLQDKTAVQHRVLCDWLRNISNQNIQLARKLTLLQKSIDSILEDESLPDDLAIEMANTNAHITDTESVR